LPCQAEHGTTFCCIAVIKTNIAIVEDDQVLRSSLEWVIGETAGLSCVGAYATGEEAVQRLPGLEPQVVLMDLNLPQMSGIECIRKLKELLPKVKVIVLTVYEDSDHIFRALKAGATGYLLKRSGPENVLAAIKDVRDGGAPMSSQIAQRVVQSFHEPAPEEREDMQLTSRESEILNLLSQGYTNKEIAERQFVSVPTVRTHLSHIYEKLHVRSRTEAIIKFLK
jgi:DNA-binding NarL/FixJ family response regulator